MHLALSVVIDLSSGGFSHVFLVKDVKTQEYYAMKRMVVDEGEHLDNAEAEIRTMESLPASRNLVRLLAWDVVDSGEMHEVLMLMEYMSGALRARKVGQSLLILSFSLLRWESGRYYQAALG